MVGPRGLFRVRVGGDWFLCCAENRLASASGAGTLAYDPLGRLQETALGVTARFGYDGMAMIAEHNSSNQLTRRYVHGPGVDEPLVWYEGSGTTDRRWLHADERGSVIAVTNSAGSATIINSYDEYGIPGAANAGRFQYTGQAWLPELGLYHYKARAYSPTLGRFLQTDPIGYGDGMNMYAYVGNDPVNATDPSGMAVWVSGPYVCSTNSSLGITIAEPGASVPTNWTRTTTHCTTQIDFQGWAAWDYDNRPRTNFASQAVLPEKPNNGPCPVTSAGRVAEAVGHAETAHSFFEHTAEAGGDAKALRPLGLVGGAVSSLLTGVDSVSRGETMDVTYVRIVFPIIGGIGGVTTGVYFGGILGGPWGAALGGFAGGLAGGFAGNELAKGYAAGAPRPRGCKQ